MVVYFRTSRLQGLGSLRRDFCLGCPGRESGQEQVQAKLLRGQARAGQNYEAINFAAGQNYEAINSTCNSPVTQFELRNRLLISRLVVFSKIRPILSCTLADRLGRRPSRPSAHRHRSRMESSRIVGHTHEINEARRGELIQR